MMCFDVIYYEMMCFDVGASQCCYVQSILSRHVMFDTFIVALLPNVEEWVGQYIIYTVDR